MKLKIGLAQMDTVLGRGEENRHRFQELLEELAGEADLVLFPETWNLGFYPQKVSQLAEGEGETTKSFVAGLARRHRVNICAGSITEGEDGKLYNTSYVFDRQGELIGCYRKIHLLPTARNTIISPPIPPGPLYRRRHYMGPAHLLRYPFRNWPDLAPWPGCFSSCPVALCPPPPWRTLGPP